MEAKYPEITLGETICRKIKDIYFPGVRWPDCYQDVAGKFTLFKNILRKIYPEKDILEILTSVQRFDTLDIQEVFSMEADYLGNDPGGKTGGMPKYDGKVVWVPVPVEKTEVLSDIRKMLVNGRSNETGSGTGVPVQGERVP